MAGYKYLIVGGGMTAAAAARGLREADPKSTIGLISAESAPPYNRPPLSKALWQGKSVDMIWRRKDTQEVEVHLRRRIKAIQPQEKQVVDDVGAVYTYEKLLLATGASPRQLPYGGDRIIYFRTVADYRRLRVMTEQGQRFAVIGGGFIGSEIAAALAMNGKEVVMIFPGTGIGDRVFPRDLSQFLNGYYQQKGVEILAGDAVEGMETQGDKITLKTRNHREIRADGVVAGIGVEPNVELAQAAGLKVNDGIVVDEFLRTSHPDIYAAGDVASFYNPALDKRLRVEHEDNANTMGRLVGHNMAGEPKPYHHLPFFYSDLFDLGYEAVGEVDRRLETVADWQEPLREGVVFYLKEGIVRGVLLWNVWQQVETAQELIAERTPFRLAELRGKLMKAA